jgi:hypothetical protein
MFGPPAKPLLVVLALLVACEEKPDRDFEEAPPRAAPALRDLAASDARVDANPSNSAVAALREHTLELPARDSPAQRIAFGGRRIAQLGQKELVVRTTSDFALVLRTPVRDPRAVAELADGSLVAADGDALYHLERDAKALKRYPRVVLLPGSLLLADRKEPKNIWVLHTLKPSLYHHVIEASESPLLPFGDVFDLGPMVRGGFVAMKDGSFLYASEGEISRVFPQGKKSSFKLPAREAKVQRLLTTRRIDHAWCVWSNGSLELFQVAPQLRSVKSWQLPSNAYDVASSDRHIGVLRWERDASGPRRWTLLILSESGEKLHSLEVPSEPAPGHGNDWVQTVTRDKTLVLSTREPVVAVGGVTSLRVWSIETGKSLFSEGN